MHTIECIGCGSTFRCDHKRKWCDLRCARRVRRIIRKTGDFVGPIMIGPNRQRIPRECKYCARQFTPHMPRARYCSKACGDAAYLKSGAKRKHKARRRELAKDGEVFDPFYVFGRDGWRCQCCGTKTPEQYRGTNHPTAPQLDHILPLSKGGKHTRLNTQLLCKRCNQSKGSGSFHDQTLLFG